MNRTIRQRTRGQAHGDITRMVSPGDLGQMLKPFVFLDYIDADIAPGFGFDFHPHSGIATLTYQLDCDAEMEDTSGQKVLVRRGGLEWMQAGGGVWHRGSLTGSPHVTGFQLWVALPEGLEDAAANALYVTPEQVPTIDGVKVLMGTYRGLQGPVPEPSPMVYLHVPLEAGESWRLALPDRFEVAWAMVFEGEVSLGGAVLADELVVLSERGSAVEVNSASGAQFIFGAAQRHPWPLILGNYSVHTNASSLANGERRIREIGSELHRRGLR
jgi:redox-sensitive bicupin YhaK (pirin superfamily)